MTYHRVNRARENICPRCMDEFRHMVKTCYFCEREYTDEGGTRGDRQDDMEAIIELLGGNRPKGREPTEEEKRQAFERWREASKARGLEIETTPVSTKDWPAMKARLQQQFAGRRGRR